jgi:hypothetical protein
VENTNPLNSAMPLLPHRLKIGGYRFADRRKARSIQLNNARESNTGFLHISRKKMKKVLRRAMLGKPRPMRVSADRCSEAIVVIERNA